MFHMPVHCTIESTDCPAAEQLLLTIGRAGVLSSRAIAAAELETLLHLLGPPRTGEQFADAAYAIARVQATLA